MFPPRCGGAHATGALVNRDRRPVDEITPATRSDVADLGRYVVLTRIEPLTSSVSCAFRPLLDSAGDRKPAVGALKRPFMFGCVRYRRAQIRSTPCTATVTVTGFVLRVGARRLSRRQLDRECRN